MANGKPMICVNLFIIPSYISIGLIPRGGGGYSHVKGLEMLIILLNGTNQRPWSHLRCSKEIVIKMWYLLEAK